MDKPTVPVVPATTSSGWTSNGVAAVNTIAAWLIIAAALWLHSESMPVIIGAMTLVLVLVFCVERGLRHLDLKAGADGVAARISDGDQPPPATVEKETSAPA